MEKATIKRITYIILLIGLSVFIAKEAFVFYTACNIHFEEPAREKLSVSAQVTDSVYSTARMVTESVLNALTSKSLKKDSMQQFMKTWIDQYSIDGLFFAVESDTISVKNNYALLLSKEFGFADMSEFFTHPAENVYKNCYDETIEKGKTWWMSSVFEETFGTRIVACCVPFYLESGEKGVAMVIYCSTRIFDRIQQLGLSRYGLPYIMDSSTAFIAHPLDETRSLGELGNDYCDPVLVRLENDLVANKKLDTDYIHRNTVTGQLCNEIFVPIKETGWLMGLSVYDGRSLESEPYQQFMKRCFIRILLLTASWIITVVLLFNEWLKKVALFYYLFPTVFLGIIIGTISVYNRLPVNNRLINDNKTDTIFEQIKINPGEQNFLNENKVYNKWDPQRIVDSKSLYDFLNRYKEESQKLYSDPVKVIPTGLYVHTIQFINSYEIRISGILWQKFLNSNSDTFQNTASIYHTFEYPKKGILFPGAQVNEYIEIDSFHVFMGENEAVLHRWTFDINLPQQLSYSLFPFGKNEITLPLWSIDLDDNTVLIPDLDSYKQLYPDVCPGLGNHFEIKGWNILNSYYSYGMESYLCDFGNTDMYGINRFPELLFNISVSRKFIDSLVCKIIPIAVVLVLLFTILFVRNDTDGFNNIIGCSGLFFVLVIDHINLRESVLSEGIMYLEYCYFFTYLLLLIITITSFQLENNPKAKQYLAWTDLLLKRHFWTCIFGVMAITTVLIFY